MLFLKSKKGKAAFDKAIKEMEERGVNQIKFSPINGGSMLLVKDGTEEASDKQIKIGSILGTEKIGEQTYLICRD